MRKESRMTVSISQSAPQSNAPARFSLRNSWQHAWRIGFCAAAITVGGYGVSVQADTYRWIDDNGVVNYSERKPKGVPASRVEVLSTGSSKSSRGSRAPASNNSSVASTRPIASANGRTGDVDRSNLNDEQLAMLDQLEQAEAERQARVTQIREDNCRRSRNVLTNLQTEGRIRLRDDSGTTRVMPEDERTRRIASAQEAIATNCS